MNLSTAAVSFRVSVLPELIMSSSVLMLTYLGVYVLLLVGFHSGYRHELNKDTPSL